MTVVKEVKTKPTRALYKRIYRAYIAGLNHAGLREAFKVSQSTVERAIDWCKKIGMDALPEKDPMVKQTLEDINFRRASLVNKLAKATNIGDIYKINEMINKLDDKRLSLKGVTVYREGLNIEQAAEKTDDELWVFIDAERKLNGNNDESE